MEHPGVEVGVRKTMTHHQDVFAVSRDNDRWLNTPRLVVGVALRVRREAPAGEVPVPLTMGPLERLLAATHEQDG